MKRQRAKLSEKENHKSVRLQVRLTAQELVTVKEMAGKQGVSVSDLVRQNILKRQVDE